MNIDRRRLVSAGLATFAALFSIAGATAPPTAKTYTPQGRTWDSIKRLPDWSGVWVLSDESFGKDFVALRGGHLPLTAHYEAIRAANWATGQPRIDNEMKCMTEGMPASAGIPIGHEYLFTPGRVTMIFENGLVRRIDTSGGKHPPESELNYTFAGHSIGHWEGKTLVVDTIGITSQSELLGGLRAVTEHTHLTERIFRKDRNILQIDTVVTDPEVFTRPYAYTHLYTHSTSAPFEYYPCTDDNRDSVVNGRQTVDLTPPPLKQP